MRVPFLASSGWSNARFGVGFSFSSDVVVPLTCLVFSFPEALLVDVLANGLETVRFGVSSFLRLEERGESSMVWREIPTFCVKVT